MLNIYKGVQEKQNDATSSLFHIYYYYRIRIANSCVTGSNHYGIAGWYTRTALEHGLLVSLSLQSILFSSFFFSYVM